ncbi:hypothetical protein [Nocardia sp. NPDC004260]
MTERFPVRTDIDDIHAPIFWPDPSPLHTWWEAVMRSDDLAVARSSNHR